MPAQAFLKLRSKRLVFTLTCSVLIVAWAKLALVQHLGLWLSVIPAITASGVLAYYNPPVAIALFFSGNYLLGQLSIAHYPSLSVLTATGAITLGAALAKRWRQGWVKSLWGANRLARMGLFCILSVWLLGLASSVFHAFTFHGSPQDGSSLFALFNGGARGANDLLPLVAAGHWYLFIALGALAVWEKREVRTFLLALSFSATLQLLAIPWSAYVEIFQSIYIKCYPMGLSYANVNRSNVGYLFAVASTIALAYAPNVRGYRKWGLYGWWVMAAWVTVLAGSKGPLLAWFLAMGLIAILTRQQVRREALAALAVAVVAIASINYAFSNRVFPCGTLLQYQIAKHSVTTRLNNIAESIKDDERDGRGEWFVGKGIGASTRSYDSLTRRMTTHSGTTNIFFDLLEDVGILGLGLFLSGVLLLTAGFFRVYPIKDRAGSEALAVAALLMILAIRLSVATETYTEDYFALMVGLLYGAAKFVGVPAKGRETQCKEAGP